MKKTIMVKLDEADKKLVEDAAYANRISMAAWIRNLIVAEAIAQVQDNRMQPGRVK